MWCYPRKPWIYIFWPRVNDPPGTLVRRLVEPRCSLFVCSFVRSILELAQRYNCHRRSVFSVRSRPTPGAPLYLSWFLRLPSLKSLARDRPGVLFFRIRLLPGSTGPQANFLDCGEVVIHSLETGLPLFPEAKGHSGITPVGFLPGSTGPLAKFFDCGQVVGRSSLATGSSRLQAGEGRSRHIPTWGPCLDLRVPWPPPGRRLFSSSG